MSRIAIIYYSAYGHVYEMAKAAADGAERFGSEVRLRRIPEMEAESNRTPFQDKFKKQESESKLGHHFQTVGRFEKYERSLAHQEEVPIATNADLRWADGIVWGFPTYYGFMPSQVKLFLEFASDLCADGGLEGKPAGLITSSGSIHTGQEAAILTSMVPLFHFGMIMVGLPYSENPEYLTADGIGCSPYGASTVAGPDSSRTPDERELVMAGRLGRRVAAVASALAASGFLNK